MLIGCSGWSSETASRRRLKCVKKSWVLLSPIAALVRALTVLYLCIQHRYNLALATKLTFIALLRSDANSNALIASPSENSPLKIGPISILLWTSASTAQRNSS